MNKLISQHDNNCVMRGISTACAVLGLPQPSLPKPVEWRGVSWVIEQIARCTQGYEVKVWCGEMMIDESLVNYQGSHFDGITDDENYLIMYSYGIKDGNQHLVIGYPPIGYLNHHISIIVAIRLEIEQ